MRPSLPRDDYTRTVFPISIVDGDTFVAEVDLGFYVYTRQSCRLAGINAPETWQPGGREATAELARLLTTDEDEVPAVVIIKSVRKDKFSGRFDAEVFVSKINEDGVPVEIHVNQRLVELGVAVPWDGKGQRPLVPWPPAAGPYAVQE